MRSKLLLVTNILASVYAVASLWTVIGFNIIDVGGKSVINSVGGFLESIFERVDMSLAITNFLYVLQIMFLIHIGLFVAGCLISWVAFALQGDNIAIVSASIYLLGTICSPICIVLGAPITILTFIAAINQRKINKTAKQ